MKKGRTLEGYFGEKPSSPRTIPLTESAKRLLEAKTGDEALEALQPLVLASSKNYYQLLGALLKNSSPKEIRSLDQIRKTQFDQLANALENPLPILKAGILAHIFAVERGLQYASRRSPAPYDFSLLLNRGVLKKATRFDAQFTPDNAAEFFNLLNVGLDSQKEGLAIPPTDQQAANFLVASYVVDALKREIIENRGGDSITFEDRLAILAGHSPWVESVAGIEATTYGDPFLASLSKEAPNYVPDKAFSDALLNPHSPRHVDAKNTLRLRFAGIKQRVNKIAYLKFLSSHNETGTDRVYDLIEPLTPLYERVGLLHLYDTYKKYVKSNDERERQSLNRVPLGGKKIVIHPRIGHLGDRLRAVVQAFPIERMPDSVLPEVRDLNQETRTALKSTLEALTFDVKNFRTLGVKTVGPIVVNNGFQFMVEPVEGAEQPTVEVHATFEDEGIEFTLDEKLNISGETGDDRTLILQTMAVAILHDLTVQKLSTKPADEKGHVIKTDEPGTEEPKRAGRIHFLESFVIVDPSKAGSDEKSTAIIENPETEEVELLRFVRPHWSEQAPQLVMLARFEAFSELLATADRDEEHPFNALPPKSQDKLFDLYTGEKSYAFSSSEFVHRYLREDLPSPDQRTDLANELTDLESKYFDELLNRFTGTGQIDYAGIEEALETEGVEGDYGRYTDLLQKAIVKAEQRGRELAKTEGVHFRMPNLQSIVETKATERQDIEQLIEEVRAEGSNIHIELSDPGARRRSTQTYVRTHIRRDTQAKKLHLRGGKGRLPDGTLVIKAGSAFGAVQKLLNLEEPS